MNPPDCSNCKCPQIKCIGELLEAQNRAVEIARESMEKRLDGMNEFRDALKDQVGDFIGRKEYQIAYDKLEADVQEFKEYRAQSFGMATQKSVNWSYLIGSGAVLISIIGLLLKK